MQPSKIRTLLSILALSVALVSCATSPGAAPDASGTWGAESGPNLTLSEDGSLTGSDGCNQLMGSWQQDGPEVDFRDVASTLKFCEGVDAWLAEVATGTVDGDTLILRNTDGESIGSLERT